MLLVSVSTFAQSSPTLQGDVNEDGVVDVADIVAVISIMKSGGGMVTGGYFYLGSTQPTADNYETLPGLVDSYTSIDEAIGTTVSIDAGQTLYMLCPAAWMDGIAVEIEDKSGNIYSFIGETDATTILGYVIYKTTVWVNGTIVKLNTVPKLNVQVGHGIDYASAVFTDTGRTLSNNMIVTISKNDGDYLFIKVDKRDTVFNLYSYPGPGLEGWEFSLNLDNPIVEGNYKLYKTINRYKEGSLQYRINKK